MEAEKNFFFLDARAGGQMVEVAVYPGTRPLALLTIVGQGGSVDGYNNKYQIIASNLVKKHGANVFIVENQQLLEKNPHHFVASAMEFLEETMVCF